MNGRNNTLFTLVACAGLAMFGSMVFQLEEANAGGARNGRIARTIRSYYAQGAAVITIIPEIPGLDGFIVTDVMVSQLTRGPSSSRLSFSTLGQEGESVVFLGTFANDDPNETPLTTTSYHFETGIRLPSGTELRARPGNAETFRITVCGFEVDSTVP